MHAYLWILSAYGEQHAGQERKIRVINIFKTNYVNTRAWVPSKMRYDSYDALREASDMLKCD